MKKFIFIFLCLIINLGAYSQDKKIAIKSIETSSFQSDEDPNYAIDSNIETIWHSSWNGTSFPVTVTLTLNSVSHIDYIRYTPRQDGNENGNWDNVTLLYASSTYSNTFYEIGQYKLNGASSTFDFTLPNGGLDVGKIRFSIKSGKNDFASAAEIEAFAYNDSKRLAFEPYFKDALFTELKEGITSSNGISDTDVKALVDNILNNADEYKKFRVGEYEAYLTTSTLQSRLKTSSPYNKYENPTGVYLKTGEKCIVMAEGIGEYPVSLTIKNWVRNESSSSYPLRNGYNYISASTEGNVFVNYYTDNFEHAPKVKMHFVNAPVQGYWDQETMTNEDWIALLNGRSWKDSTIIITRSKHAQLAFPICAWTQYCPINIDSTMTLFQNVQWAERNMMGLEKYGREVKNRQLFYATTYGFMAADNKGAYCNISSLRDIMIPSASTFDFWGVGHEWGHNNQITPGFLWTGCGETTNNIYASWAQLHFTGNRNNLRLEDETSGVGEYSGMRGGRMQAYFEEGLRKGVQWQLQDGPDHNSETPTSVTVTGQDADGRNTGTVNTTWRHYDHFVKVVPFWQLNLWGTLAGKCPDIIPMVIEAIRSDDNYSTKYNTNGKQQVNWMKIACDSAKINLLPFFEKAGMLRPINAYVDDYTKGWNIISEQMINDLKAYVKEKGYPAFTEEINYINAHNYHIYRDNLPVEAPGTLGSGCTYSNGKVTVQHNTIKNAVAFETYNSAGELLRITMYGLGSNDSHSFTQVLYPSSTDEATSSAYIMAVGYDGTRVKIYENTNAPKTLVANKYYRITSFGKGYTLSCGASTTVESNGNITWNLVRASKSEKQADQIWMMEKRGENIYLYNPQSTYYFGGTANTKTTTLSRQDEAPAWVAKCVDEELDKYTFNIKGSDNYMNSYNYTETGLWTGGSSDSNNIWIVEEVTTFPITIPDNQYTTACHPFALETPNGMTAYVVSGYGIYNYEGTDYNYALLEKIESKIIPAYMPVIYSATAGTYNLNIVDNDNTEVTATNILQGATLKKRLGADTFLSTTASSTEAGTTAIIKNTMTETQVAANKGYLLKTDVGNASQLYLGVKSTVAVESIQIEKGEITFYNLDGTIATELQSGRIYITSDGRKILAK